MYWHQGSVRAVDVVTSSDSILALLYYKEVLQLCESSPDLGLKVSAIPLVTSTVYSQCLPSHWSLAQFILSVCHPIGH